MHGASGGITVNGAKGDSRRKVEDEIASLELLAELAEDADQRGRAKYCRRRVAKLRKALAQIAGGAA